jgi:hypothetical protein
MLISVALLLLLVELVVVVVIVIVLRHTILEDLCPQARVRICLRGVLLLSLIISTPFSCTRSRVRPCP